MEMKYRVLGSTGIQVSELCLGTMQFQWTTTEANSYRVLDAFTDWGGNFIDTADCYSYWAEGCKGGEAETIIGKWMKRKGNRRNIVLATKTMVRMWPGATGEGLSRAHIVKSVEDSLRRLQTDSVDLLQSHWPDWNTPNEETLRAYDDLMRAGKVHAIGCSNYPASLLAEAMVLAKYKGLPPFATIQPKYNLIVRNFEKDHVWLCKKYSIGVIPYSPLQGGFLTGKYRRGKPLPKSGRAEGLKSLMTEKNWNILDTLRRLGRRRGKTVLQMALGWQLSHDWMTAPIIGANTPGQLKESFGAVGLKLTDAEMAELNKVSGKE